MIRGSDGYLWPNWFSQLRYAMWSRRQTAEEAKSCHWTRPSKLESTKKTPFHLSNRWFPYKLRWVGHEGCLLFCIPKVPSNHPAGIISQHSSFSWPLHSLPTEVQHLQNTSTRQRTQTKPAGRELSQFWTAPDFPNWLVAEKHEWHLCEFHEGNEGPRSVSIGHHSKFLWWRDSASSQGAP